MKDSRHIIWTDYLDYDDWKEDLEAQYPEPVSYTHLTLPTILLV